MRTILYLLQKEFVQIFRNKSMLPVIFIIPIVQLLVLVHAATFDMKNIKMIIVDHDLSSSSRSLAGTFSGSPFFEIEFYTFSKDIANEKIYEDKADIILNIPAGFEEKIIKESVFDIQILINAINGSAAGLINAYAKNLIHDFSLESLNNNTIVPLAPQKRIQVEYSFWYNPVMNYKTYMVPGILVLLVTIIAMFLSAMNVVREKELGTIEQINVSPIKKYQFISGKLIPFWIIAMFELAFGLALGKLLFNIPIMGDISLIFIFAAVYLLVVLGLGLFISTLSETQQQSMFFSFFFMMIFILMSGLFTPVESMPDWAKAINKINPVSYFIRVMRMILLKGSCFRHVLPEFYSLLIFAAIILSLAIWRYKKRG
jgi:ABC-2 type transport system permease protein